MNPMPDISNSRLCRMEFSNTMLCRLSLERMALMNCTSVEQKAVSAQYGKMDSGSRNGCWISTPVTLRYGIWMVTVRENWRSSKDSTATM